MRTTISTRQATMLIQAVPNLILAVFAVVGFAYQVGWQAMLSLPYNILMVWLAYSAFVAFGFKLSEVREQEHAINHAKDLFKEAIAETVKQAIIEAIKERRNEGGNYGEHFDSVL